MKKPSARRLVQCAKPALFIVIAAAGCAGPGPILFPIGPLRVERLPDGRCEQWYDLDDDGVTEYAECVNAHGIIDALRYSRGPVAIGQNSRSASATPAPDNVELVRLADVPAAERRDLVLILDSVPFDMVRDLRLQGRFQFFPRPTRVIAPFPVMTDLSLAEFFGASPCPGVEASYYDGTELTFGYEKYAVEGNTPWLPYTHYRMDPRKHFHAYLDPPPWFDHELCEIQQLFAQRADPLTVAYCVGTSAIGAKSGRDGHQAAMIRVDRLCRRIMHDTRGRARISMFSDHGHDFAPSRRIRFATRMKELGYHDGPKLEQPLDVIAVEFGLVTCGAIYTRRPAPTAADAIGLEGVELAAYVQDRAAAEAGDADSRPAVAADDPLVVISRDGLALIERRSNGYRYAPRFGDPLQLRPVWAMLAARGAIDADGFADDRALFEATQLHAYPDVVHRLWRAFHGLVKYPPEVLLSAEPGFHFGAKLMQDFVHVVGLHGSLRLISTSGFALSMGGEMPEVARMEDLRGDFRAVGVAIPGSESKRPGGVTDGLVSFPVADLADLHGELHD